MATSGTYTFLPSVGELMLNAFARCQVRRPELTPEHIANAKMECNLLQTDWSNDGVTLWTVDLQTIPLVQGTQTYTVPGNTVMILDLYINNGTSNRLIMPFSRTDFASISNPTQEGFPTAFWFDRLIAPTISFWEVPDGNATYTASYYRYRMIQDADTVQGTQPEVPYLWLDAWAAGLAHRLSRIYAPPLEGAREKDAMLAFAKASRQGVENVPIYVSPGLSGYYR